MPHGSDLRSLLGFIEGHRILVLGGSGWLGRTMVRQLLTQRPEALLVTSTDGRNIEVGGESVRTYTFSRDLVRAFDPTVVLNFAAITRDAVQPLGVHRFLETNRALFEHFIWASDLPRVVMSIHLSSGAALQPAAADAERDPYGYMKRLEEMELREQVNRGRRVLIARVWSVSGDLVSKPSIYAFSDLVLQGLMTGVVRVRSLTEVWRRYTSAGRFLSVALASCWHELGVELDSGGPKVEIRELAMEVGAVTGSEVLASEPRGVPDDYTSDGVDYERACQWLGLPEESLGEQVVEVVRAFQDRARPP